MKYLAALAVVALLQTPAVSIGQTPSHPLDALTAREYWAILDAVKASGRTDSLTRFVGVNLREPSKDEVLRWRSGDSFPRRALVVVRQGPRIYEVVVDLRENRVASWDEVLGVQPNHTIEELEAIGPLVEENADWRAAMARREIHDYSMIQCYGGVLGYFDTPEERGRRLARAACFDRHGQSSEHNPEISGVVALVDLDSMQVLRIIDTGVVPVSRTTFDHDPEAVGRTRDVPSPIYLQQPQGPGYSVEGHEVGWQNCRFHFRIDPQTGVVVSDVRYADGERLRPVLYQGGLTEIFVPYMDPGEDFYFINFLDMTEWSFGFASSLERGTDCPDHATFFDAVYADEEGVPQREPRAACLFEREAGDLSWRHRTSDKLIESRARRDLVLRMIATVGNYDYLVDWVFLQDGTIRVVAGATGMNIFRSVSSRTAGDDHGGTDAAYGRFIADHTVAVNHDHFLSFRLDLDVDGTENSFVMDRLTPKRMAAESPRKSVWVVESSTARTERDGKLHMSMERPAVWRVVNPAARGPMGYPASYQIRPGHTAVSLLSDDDNPQLRGAFSRHPLWITGYSGDERLAAGKYQTGSRGGEGLPRWTSADRPIENTDIVVWYTMGLHHVARTEDWPVMPMALHEFELRPFDFFVRNPAIDLPGQP